ncbi:MAG TPA: hypothetical protein VK164_07085 [Flavobacterium sp.]|uniref:hypothetical protein n=1 Tax=Flavobacterium sp. TaxID=239 RepID=UPI002B4AF84B|nr:hypothetical protein [Flavobacterium sp.]HLO73683.1 hypothetical protein [Flavobacterium sp.]
MKKIITLLLLTSVLINCKSTENQEVEGLFINKTIAGSEFLKIYSNHTFEFYSEIPLLISKSKGNWYLRNDAIIINSYPEYKNDYFVAEESLKESDDKSIIYVIDENDEGIYGVNFIINGNIHIATNEEGKIIVNNYSFNVSDKIEFSSINLSSEKNVYSVKKSKSNFIKIKIFNKNYEKKYFENDTIKIKRNKIILRNENFNKLK